MPRTSVIGRLQGFTLLELMVVMAILVMIAAVFPFALDRAMPSRRVSTTAERLVTTVQEAQSASLRTGRPVTVALNGHGLVTQDAVTSATLARPLQLPASTDVRLADLEGHPVAALTVYPDGSAQSVHFDLEDNGHHGAVVVSAVTGRISIVAGH
jgi:type II secretion system protein H